MGARIRIALNDPNGAPWPPNTGPRVGDIRKLLESTPLPSLNGGVGVLPIRSILNPGTGIAGDYMPIRLPTNATQDQAFIHDGFDGMGSSFQNPELTHGFFGAGDVYDPALQSHGMFVLPHSGYVDGSKPSGSDPNGNAAVPWPALPEIDMRLNSDQAPRGLLKDEAGVPGYPIEQLIGPRHTNRKGFGVGENNPAATLHVTDTGRSLNPSHEGTSLKLPDALQSPIAIDGLRYMTENGFTSNVVAVPDWRDPSWPYSKTDLLYKIGTPGQNIQQRQKSYGKAVHANVTPIAGGVANPHFSGGSYYVDTFEPDDVPDWVNLIPNTTPFKFRDTNLLVDSSDPDLMQQATILNPQDPFIEIHLPEIIDVIDAELDIETGAWNEAYDNHTRVITIKDVAGNIGTGPGKLRSIHIVPATVNGVMQRVDQHGGSNGPLCVLEDAYCSIKIMAKPAGAPASHPEWSIIP